LAGVVLLVRHWLVPYPRAHAPLNRLTGPPLSLDEQSLFGTAEPARWSLRFREAALLVGCFSLAAVVLTWPLARLDSVTDLGDPLFSIWRLAWIGHQLPRNPLGLFETNLFYPERLTGTYSDTIIVPGILVSPLFWAGVHPVTVYNLLILICCAL
jgi:hypothetical protein